MPVRGRFWGLPPPLVVFEGYEEGPPRVAGEHPHGRKTLPYDMWGLHLDLRSICSV